MEVQSYAGGKISANVPVVVVPRVAVGGGVEPRVVEEFQEKE